MTHLLIDCGPIDSSIDRLRARSEFPGIFARKRDLNLEQFLVKILI